MNGPVIAPISLLRLGQLSDDEQRILSYLLNVLASYGPGNDRNELYYEGKQSMRHIGIALPPEVATRVKPVVGWAGTVVDTIEERLDWYGWTDASSQGDALGLDEVYAENRLDVESGPGHLDACLYGTSFVRVGSGRPGEYEPSPLVTVHSPRTTTGEYSMRTRRLMNAVTITEVVDARYDVSPAQVVLDVPGVTITLERKITPGGGPTGLWDVIDRDEHGLDRIPVVQLANRPRASRPGGTSELTRALRYYCDAAVRTVLGMEGNREFYGIPQLTLLGRGRDAFVDDQGRPTSGWRVLAGHVLAIDKDDEGDVPTMKQLSVGSPQPFLDQVKGWALLVATEAGLPYSYLGYNSDNPASADAIRALEIRLVKRSERRQTSFGWAWLEVGLLALMIRDGVVPADFFTRVGNRWRDAATPTRAAAADETTKYVAVGVLPPDSRVTYDRMGLSPTEQRQLIADKERIEATRRAEAEKAQEQLAPTRVGQGGGINRAVAPQTEITR